MDRFMYKIYEIYIKKKQKQQTIFNFRHMYVFIKKKNKIQGIIYVLLFRRLTAK